jgi:ferredoxin-NADP reductase
MALPPTYRSRLTEKLVFTHNVRDFVLELSDPPRIEFKGGQFVLVKMRHPETGEPISRAYSIASAPHRDREVVLNVQIIEGGKLTPLMEQWAIGQEVELQGPFGHFVMKSGPEKELLFVATGTGIAPFRSMIEELLAKKDPRRMRVYFGLRHEKDIFYKDLFEALAARHSNLEFTLTLSQPEGGWTGLSGRVTAHVPKIELNPEKTDAYLCGGKTMIDEVKAMLMERGMEKSQIFFEQFFL